MQRFSTVLLTATFLVLFVVAADSNGVQAQRGNADGVQSARAQRLSPQSRAWLGTYGYTELAGRTTGGTAIVISHVIHVDEENGALFADVSSDGYQTYRRLRCDARIVGNRLHLYYLNNNYSDGYNAPEMYRRGELLLTLERTRNGRILTFWRAMQPAALRRWSNGRVYFTRVRMTEN